eukprot:8723014-Pyramimonas_sp.AAC.1
MKNSSEPIWSHTQRILSGADAETNCIRMMNRPLLGNFCSSPCIGFSPRGHGAGDGHESNRAFNAWLVERRALADQGVEDFFFHENAATFPSNRKIHGPLQSSHFVWSVKFGPENQGWPTNRRRTLTFGFNKDTMQWHGPRSMDEVAEEFNQLMGNTICSVSADVFLVDTAEG